jgi:WD40 repeat protein
MCRIFQGSHSIHLVTRVGTRLLSGGDDKDPTIREWDVSTWEQVAHPWKGHTRCINAIAIHPDGTLAASASDDEHVRLWRVSDQQTIAIFQYSSPRTCVTFSAEGKDILSLGDLDKKISECVVPKDANNSHSHNTVTTRASFMQTPAITTARDACITGDLPTAEELLTKEIHTDANNYISYAYRSFIMARKHVWDHALQDAIKVIYTDPSWSWYDRLTFIGDIVHQHSPLIDRLHLQRHRPLRQRPRPRG